MGDSKSRRSFRRLYSFVFRYNGGDFEMPPMELEVREEPADDALQIKVHNTRLEIPSRVDRSILRHRENESDT